jgi:hypothetical protein
MQETFHHVHGHDYANCDIEKHYIAYHCPYNAVALDATTDRFYEENF